jgi:hypothetical protein
LSSGTSAPGAGWGVGTAARFAADWEESDISDSYLIGQRRITRFDAGD